MTRKSTTNPFTLAITDHFHQVYYGNSTADTFCLPCPAGTYSTTLNQEACGAASTCQPPYFRSKESTPTTDAICMQCPLNTFTDTNNAELCKLSNSIQCSNPLDTTIYKRVAMGAIMDGVTEIFSNTSNPAMTLNVDKTFATFSHTDANISFSSAIENASWVVINEKNYLDATVKEANLTVGFYYFIYKDSSVQTDVYYSIDFDARSENCELTFDKQALKSGQNGYVHDSVLILLTPGIPMQECRFQFRIEVLPILCPVMCNLVGYEFFNESAPYPYNVASQNFLSNTFKCQKVSCEQGSMRTSPFSTCKPCNEICNYSNGEYLADCSNNDYLGQYSCLPCQQSLGNYEEFYPPTDVQGAINPQCVKGCITGYQNNTVSNICEPCDSVSCSNDLYLPLGACTCKACSNNCTSSSEYISRNCTTNNDVTCTPCTTCDSTQYTQVNCSKYANAICSPCNTICPNGLFKSANCSQFSDIQCSPADVNFYSNEFMLTQKPCPPNSSTNSSTGQSRCICNFAFYDFTPGNAEPDCRPLICQNQTNQYIDWNDRDWECKNCPLSSRVSTDRKTCICNKGLYGDNFVWNGLNYMVQQSSSCQACPSNSTSDCLAGYYDYCYEGLFYTRPQCKCFDVPNAASVTNSSQNCLVTQCSSLYKKTDALQSQNWRWNVRYKFLMRAVRDIEKKTYSISPTPNIPSNIFLSKNPSVSLQHPNIFEVFINQGTVYQLLYQTQQNRLDVTRFSPTNFGLGSELPTTETSIDHIAPLSFDSNKMGFIISTLSEQSKLQYLISYEGGQTWYAYTLFNVDNLVSMTTCQNTFWNLLFYAETKFPGDSSETHITMCDLSLIQAEFSDRGEPEKKHCKEIYKIAGQITKLSAFTNQRFMSVIIFPTSSKPLFFLEQNNAEFGNGFKLKYNRDYTTDPIPITEWNNLSFQYDTEANFSNSVLWSRFFIFTKNNQNTIFLYDMYQNYTGILLNETMIVPASKQPAQQIQLLSTWNDKSLSNLGNDVGYLNVMVIDVNSEAIYIRFKLKTSCDSTEKVESSPDDAETCINIPCVKEKGKLCPENSLSNGYLYTSALSNCYCIAGFYKANAGDYAANCISCPQDSYCPEDNSNNKQSCQAPKLKSFPQSESDDACFCPPGTFLESGLCTTCPENFWCPGNNLKTPCSTTTCVADLNGVPSCTNNTPTTKTSPAGSSRYEQCVCPSNTKTRDCIPCQSNEVCRPTYASAATLSLTFATNGLTQASSLDWLQYINSTIQESLLPTPDYRIQSVTLVPPQSGNPKTLNTLVTAFYSSNSQQLYANVSTTLSTKKDYGQLRLIAFDAPVTPSPYSSDFTVAKTCSSSQTKQGDNCICLPGYTDVGGSCNPCPIDFYNQDGNQCLPCGSNATSNGNTAATSCSCTDPLKVWTSDAPSTSCLNQDEPIPSGSTQQKQSPLMLIGIVIGSVIGGFFLLNFVVNVTTAGIEYVNSVYVEEEIATTKSKIPSFIKKKNKYRHYP